MKQNKSILHLCEVILGVLMLILILNLYLVKLLVDPDISYTPMYRNLCLTLALLVFCMVLALIQRELLARLLHNAYRDVTGIHNKKSLEKMLMYGREAQSKTRIASPATIPKSGERNRKIHSCMLYLISI